MLTYYSLADQVKPADRTADAAVCRRHRPLDRQERHDRRNAQRCCHHCPGPCRCALDESGLHPSPADTLVSSRLMPRSCASTSEVSEPCDLPSQCPLTRPTFGSNEEGEAGLLSTYHSKMACRRAHGAFQRPGGHLRGVGPVVGQRRRRRCHQHGAAAIAAATSPPSAGIAGWA